MKRKSPKGRAVGDTIVSKIIAPEFLFFSELIRRGVVYYASNFYPNLFFLINYAGHFCITLCGSTVLGAKITPQKSSAN